MQIKQHKNTGLWISDEGQIKGSRVEWRKAQICNSGYNFIHSKGKNYFIHRLVVETFIGEIPKGYVVNHIDGIKTNNNLNNLEIVTYSQNSKHAFQMGLKIPLKSENHPNAKLNNNDYRNIIKLILLGKTNEEISEKYNLHSRYVSLIRHKKRLKNIWEEFSETASNSLGSFGISIEQCKSLIKELSLYNNKELSIKYNVDASTVSRVRRKLAWKSIWSLVEKESKSSFIKTNFLEIKEKRNIFAYNIPDGDW